MDNKEIDEILQEIESAKAPTDVSVDTLAEDARKRREEQVKGFSLNLDVDEFIADVPVANDNSDTPSEEVMDTAEAIVPDTLESETSTPALEQPKAKVKRSRKRIGRLIYIAAVALISILIACGGLFYFFEASGLKGNDTIVEVTIEQGAYTKTIADTLKDKGLINNTFFFRVYAKIAKADGKWQTGTFMLSSNMGFSGLVEELQTSTPRESVNVTIPEGYTVQDIARLLDEKGVCTEDEFYNAVVNGDFDYDFVKAIPTSADGEQYAGRIYRLEGYLFPDTYNFYVGSTGEIVVDKMLQNFDSKLTPAIRQQIADKGWTIDEAIIFASVVQGEAGLKDDMDGVSRVLTNRMKPNSGFTKLQCDSTGDYAAEILPSLPGIEVKSSAYNTYVREGLPVGAINNPGMLAIQAALNPSNDTKHINCYYFATDYNTGITYFTKTLTEHEAICRKYKIGMYG